MTNPPSSQALHAFLRQHRDAAARHADVDHQVAIGAMTSCLEWTIARCGDYRDPMDPWTAAEINAPLRELLMTTIATAQHKGYPQLINEAHKLLAELDHLIEIVDAPRGSCP